MAGLETTRSHSLYRNTFWTSTATSRVTTFSCGTITSWMMTLSTSLTTSFSIILHTDYQGTVTNFAQTCWNGSHKRSSKSSTTNWRDAPIDIDRNFLQNHTLNRYFHNLFDHVIHIYFHRYLLGDHLHTNHSLHQSCAITNQEDPWIYTIDTTNGADRKQTFSTIRSTGTSTTFSTVMTFSTSTTCGTIRSTGTCHVQLFSPSLPFALFFVARTTFHEIATISNALIGKYDGNKSENWGQKSRKLENG